MTDTTNTGADTNDRRPIRLWYMGQRRATGEGDKLYHLWLDDTGTERLYAKLKGRAIGSAYLVDTDGPNVFLNTLRLDTEHRDFHDDIATWQADHDRTLTLVKARRLEAAAVRDGTDAFKDMTLRQAGEWINAPVNNQDRRARMAVVLNALHV